MTSPRDDVTREELEDLIGVVAGEMTRGEPSGELLLRVRDRIDGSRTARHWAWRTAPVGVLLLLALLIAIVLRTPEGGPSEHVAAGPPPPQAAPPSALPPAPPRPGAGRSPERTRPAVRVSPPVRTPIGSPMRQPVVPRMAGLPGLPAPEPLMVTVSGPTELEAPAEIVLTSLALEDLWIPALNPWKESR